MEAEHVEWCRRTWSLMRDGGVWGIPRTGLLFKKLEAEKTLMLIDRFVPVIEEARPGWRELQEEDLEACREHFAVIGVEVVWSD
jgi:hypothetical protein